MGGTEASVEPFFEWDTLLLDTLTKGIDRQI